MLRSSLPRREMRTSRRCPSNRNAVSALFLWFTPDSFHSLPLRRDSEASAHCRASSALKSHPSSLFLHLPRGHPVQSPFASLRANLRFTICALACFVTPHPPLIRRAIQIPRFLTAIVGGGLGERVKLHRLAVERFPLTAGAAPRFGGNIRSEGKLTL